MGTLDPRKLIELKINHMNIFYMKISQITIFVYSYSISIAKCLHACCILQVERVQKFKILVKRTVLMSAPQMMTVKMIGYVVVMDAEDMFALILLKCVRYVRSISVVK